MPNIHTELTDEALPYSPYALPLPAAFSQHSSAMLKFANRIRPGWQATRRHPFFDLWPIIYVLRQASWQSILRKSQQAYRGMKGVENPLQK